MLHFHHNLRSSILSCFTAYAIVNDWNFVHFCQKPKNSYSKIVNFTLVRQLCTAAALPSVKVIALTTSNNSSLVNTRSVGFKSIRIKSATHVKNANPTIAMLHLTGRRIPFSYCARVIWPTCSSGITTWDVCPFPS